MTKAKYLIILLSIIAILLIPSISKAETLTYNDTAQNIEWSYELDSTGNNVINLQCNTKTASGTVNIPSSINGKPVTSLKKGSYGGTGSAFRECISITGITIPDTITQIPDYAFEKLTGLKTITIPNTVTLIGEYALAECTGLTSINLPNNLIEIGDNAFDSCSGLKNITIPNTVVEIGSYAFSGCAGLKSIVVPNSVTTIGRGAFSKCSGLTSVTLSNKISVIDELLFNKCTSLKSLIIPDSVTTIKSGNFGVYSAFYGCTNLEKILIPDSVATIEDDVFEGCKKLTIYGNDGMKSKEYAEENKIKFDYIANWNKASSGSDVTPPTVQSIQVPHTSVLNYYDSNSKMYVVPTGKVVTINVNFSEEIEGTTSPTLTIKFGSGKNIELTNGTIQGKKITYTYTIKSTDKGIMTAVELKGGNIKDTAGNTATLSCPTLKVELVSSNVYANGTTSKPSSSTGQDKNEDPTETEKPGSGSGSSSSGSGSSSSSSNNSSSNKGDTTTSPSKIPNTGVGLGIACVIITILGVGVFTYFKYNNLRDI